MTFLRKYGLCCLLSATTFLTTDAYATSTLTLTQELAAKEATVPVYKPLSADLISNAVEIDTGSVSNGLGICTIGTPTASSQQYFGYDSSTSVLTATLTSGGTTWESYASSALSASYSATTTINLTQTLANGTATTTKIFKITFTATGTPAALTSTVIGRFLQANTVSVFAASTAGTSLAAPATASLTTGWAAKAYMDNGSGTAVASTLDPVSAVLTLPITPQSSSTALSFTTTLTNLHSWNVGTSSTTSYPVNFTTPSGYQIDFDVIPGKFGRTVGIATGIVNLFTSGLPSTHVNQTRGYFENPLPTAITAINQLLTASPSGSTNTQLLINTIANSCISGANTLIGDFTTKTGDSKWAFVTSNTGGSDLSSCTWSIGGTGGTHIILNAKVGSTGTLKNFSYDLNSLSTKTIVDDTNPVIQLTCDDLDAVWIKCFDTTGIDGTTVTNGQANQLAVLLLNKINAITSITYSGLDAIVTAALS